MQYEIKGTPFPAVICHLQDGEQMITEGGGMSWMTPNMVMETTTNGGLAELPLSGYCNAPADMSGSPPAPGGSLCRNVQLPESEAGMYAPRSDSHPYSAKDLLRSLLPGSHSENHVP